MKYLFLCFLLVNQVFYAQSIRVNDTDFSKGKLGYTQEITLEDVAKFHGHSCDGLVEGFLALREALLYLYPEGIIDRTNTRIVSKSSPCLTDVAIYLTGGRAQFNTFYVDDKVNGLYFVQRMDNKQGVYVRRKEGLKPRIIDSLGLLAIAQKLSPCELRMLEFYENKYAQDLLEAVPEEIFELYEQTSKTQWKWKPKNNKIFVKTDIINKNQEACDITDPHNKALFLQLSPEEFATASQDKNALILDVRSTEELEETGYIRQAINIDYWQEGFEKSLENLNKNTTYFVYCKGGARSFAAMEIMKNLGFKKLIMLEGGILSWMDEYLPLQEK